MICPLGDGVCCGVTRTAYWRKILGFLLSCSDNDVRYVSVTVSFGEGKYRSAMHRTRGGKAQVSKGPYPQRHLSGQSASAALIISLVAHALILPLKGMGYWQSSALFLAICSHRQWL